MKVVALLISWWKAKTQSIALSNVKNHTIVIIYKPNPNQKHPASSKAPGLKEHKYSLYVQFHGRKLEFALCLYQRFQITRCQTPIRNLQHFSLPQARLLAHQGSLQLLLQFRELKFRTGLYQRSISISNS